MIVAIDGPAGSGKSTVAHAVAKKRHLTYLDTGAMYRAVTWLCLHDGVSLDDQEAVAEEARGCKISFGAADDGGQTVAINGNDVTKAIRTPEIDRTVSIVSAIPAVREAMVALQRQVGESGDVIAEGRDIGTVVFPKAEVKVFLTADASARAHRRAVQREGSDAATDPDAKTDQAEEAQILADIERRDKLDSTRKAAPLKAAEDAVRIDSSNLTVNQVVDKVVALIDQAKQPKSKPEVEGEGKVGQTKKAKPKAQAEGRLKAFRGNSYDDYFEHGMHDYPLPARAFLGFAVCVVAGVTKVLWRWKWEDIEKVWGDKKGRVLIMNHESMLEPVVVIVSGYLHGCRVRTIYKDEFNKVPLAKWLFSRAGAIPVKRGTADIKAVRRAQAALRRGEFVLIYPEGTRIRSDEQEVTIHGGFALMAQMGRSSVQPCAVVGARQITPQGTHWKRFCKVFLKAGDPISFSDLEAKSRKAKIAEMEKVSMDRVYELRDELRREHPGKE